MFISNRNCNIFSNLFIQKVFLLIYNLFKYYYSLLIISSSFCKKTSRPDSISKNDHENNEVIVLEELDKGKQNFEENKSNIINNNDDDEESNLLKNQTEESDLLKKQNEGTDLLKDQKRESIFLSNDELQHTTSKPDLTFKTILQNLSNRGSTITLNSTNNVEVNKKRYSKFGPVQALIQKPKSSIESEKNTRNSQQSLYSHIDYTIYDTEFDKFLKKDNETYKSRDNVINNDSTTNIYIETLDINEKPKERLSKKQNRILQ